MAPGVELRRRLSNLSLKASSLALERGCRLAVTVAAAPVLGRAAFGRFVFASTVTALLVLGSDLGLGLWTTRALARDRSDGERIVRTGLVLRGLASIPYALAVAAVATFSRDRGVGDAVALLGAAAMLNAFADHAGAVFRGYERFTEEARLGGVRALATVAGGLAAFGFARSLPGLCAGLAAAAAVSFAWGLVRILRMHPSWGSTGRWFDRPMARAALGQSLPIWIAGLLSVVYFKIDTLFVRAFAGDAELGAYGAAYKLFEGAQLLPAIVMAVTFPELARAHADPGHRRRLERWIGSWLLGLGLAVGAAGWAGGSALVDLIFGPSFQRSTDSLRVLAFGIPLLYVNFGLTHFLVARDRERVNTWLALMMLVTTVVFDVALIPRRSGPGAALATVLAEVALTAGCLGMLAMGRAPARTPPSVQASPRTDRRAA
jgi:O-antigen/teichoic acid export membrane protein